MFDFSAPLRYAKWLYSLAEGFEDTYRDHKASRESAFVPFRGEHRDTADVMAADLDGRLDSTVEGLKDAADQWVVSWVREVDSYNDSIYEEELAQMRHIMESNARDDYGGLYGIAQVADAIAEAVGGDLIDDDPTDRVERPRSVSGDRSLWPTRPDYNVVEPVFVYYSGSHYRDAHYRSTLPGLVGDQLGGPLAPLLIATGNAISNVTGVDPPIAQPYSPEHGPPTKPLDTSGLQKLPPIPEVESYSKHPKILRQDSDQFDTFGYEKGQCTSYAALRLYQVTGIDILRHNNGLFNRGKLDDVDDVKSPELREKVGNRTEWEWWGWSHASYWDDFAEHYAKQHPGTIEVGQLPQPGSIAQWDRKGEKLPFGHVAFVEAVTYTNEGDLSSIKISEANVNGKAIYTNPNTWQITQRLIKRDDNSWPDNFIHFTTEDN